MKLNSFADLHSFPGYLMRRAGQFVTATFNAELGGMGITSGQLAVVLAAYVKPGMQQHELADSLNWDAATVGGMIRRLEARGLLEGRRSPRSRRGKEIFLTEAGKEFYTHIEPHVATVQKNVLKALSPDERKQVLYLLSKMMGETNNHFPPKSQTGKAQVKNRS